MIVSVKTCYKTVTLRSLRTIYDNEAAYNAAKHAKMKAKACYVGLAHGQKPHILDCMKLLKSIWDNDADGGGAAKNSIMRCWLKSRCLPAEYHTELEKLVPPSKRNHNKSKKLCLQSNEATQKIV